MRGTEPSTIAVEGTQTTASDAAGSVEAGKTD